MAKYKSIVGGPFASYVDGQLAERHKIISSRDRNSQQLRWLSNRVGWYRMSSGAIDTVDGENLAIRYILEGCIQTKNIDFGGLKTARGKD